MKQKQLTKEAGTTAYLKTERSQSQELFGKAIKKQTAATSHATETIPIETLDTF